MTPYEIICQEVALIENETKEFSPPPYNSNANENTKLSITYQCLLRAKRLKQCKKILIYTYYLGKFIEIHEVIAKKVK